jgi:predicted HicB family RNase H-like nuclease
VERSPDKTITLRLRPEVHRRLRVVLAREGKSLQWLMSDYVYRYLEAKEKTGDRAG